MNYVEQAFTIPCGAEHLVGILARPEHPARVGLLVIVGGPQYRAGSHRQFVRLSRHIAQAGFAVLRIDYRGMGDSTGEFRDFQDVQADIAAGIDTLLSSVFEVKEVALWGLCDAASAALMYINHTRDARVAGLCLLNPWVRSEVSLARTQVKHYYLQRLAQRAFWAKLLSGKVAGGAIAGLYSNIRAAMSRSNKASAGDLAPFQQRMAAAWQQFPGRMMLVLSGEDYTAKEFLDHAQSDAFWRSALDRPQLQRHDLEHADHTFSQMDEKSRVEQLTVAWLQEQVTNAEG